MISYILTGVNQLQQQHYTQRVDFFQSCMDNKSSDFGFAHRIILLIDVSLTVQYLQTLRTFVPGAQKTQRDIQNMDHTAGK